VLPDVHYVFHAHSPEIWLHAKTLGIASTTVAAEYGTPDIAKEIQRLCQIPEVHDSRILSMGGHEDGIIAFGETAAEAGTTLIRYLAASVAIKA
jgi:hypothetical protein